MKKTKNSLLFGIAAVGFMMLAACNNNFSPAQQAPGKNPSGESGYGRVSVRVAGGGAERTVLPPVPIFDKYEYTFTKEGETPVQVDPEIDPADNKEYFWLEPGTYKVEVKAYNDDGSGAGNYVLMAQGESEKSFEVKEDVTIAVTVKLEPVGTTGTGKFKYKITYPYDAVDTVTATITLVDWPGETTDYITAPSTDDLVTNTTTATDELSLPVGSYLLTIRIEQSGKYAGLFEAVHIYDGQTTEFNQDFISEDLIKAFTVTFNKNTPAYAPASIDANPATMNLINPTTTISALPTEPVYDPAWDAGVTFDGWNTKADGTGTKFDENTEVTEDITVYAKWKFTAGTAQTVGADLVLDAPAMQSAPTIGTFTGKINADGSATYRAGGFYTSFPTGYANYDFVEVEWVYTNDNINQPSDMVFKRGNVTNDYEAVEGANSQYWKPNASTVSGTASKKFPVLSGVTGIGLQIYWDGSVAEADRFDVTIKITKLTFTLAPKHTLTFDVGTGKPIDDMVITEGKPFVLPFATNKNGDRFLRWEDPQNNRMTNASVITTNLVLTAVWKTPTQVSDLPVVFDTNTTFGLIGALDGKVEVYNQGTNNGYTFTYGTGAYQASQVKFTVALPAGANLTDYASITLSVQGTTANPDAGKTQYKDLAILAGTPLPDSWSAIPIDGEYQVGTKFNYTNNSRTFTVAITSNADLTGQVEFSIYTPADSANTQPRTYRVTNVKLNAKTTPPEPAPPLTIDLSTAAEQDGSGNPIVFKDVSAASNPAGNEFYTGISFKLSDQFPASGLALNNYNQITIVTECYSDTAGTMLVTSGNALFNATLFEPWKGYAPGDFPGWHQTPANNGRLQAITAGVNSHGTGVTTTINTMGTVPQGIRFERNNNGADGGRDLLSIKIISITFSNSDYY
jgi:uncharacterized repeat protein (TIGR02543 family)